MSESLFLIKRATALLAFALLCLFQSDGCLAGESKVRLERLRCESRTDPLGIDETAPRLGWLLQSEERGQRQTAYRILVASSTSRLAAGQADLWDSGKVTSDNNTAVVYAGKPLKSGQSCHWKVMAWDAQERSTAWSKPALWSMGLLEPEDWEAEWIGYDAERVVESQDADFEDCQWICHADDPAKDAPAGHRLYVARFELPEEARVEQAEVLAVADDQLWMAVNEKMVVHGEPGWQRVKPVSVADVLKPGTNELRFNIKNDSPGPTGLLVRLTIKLASGKEIKIRSDQSWFSCGNPGQHWPAEPLDESKVKPAQTIGPYGIKPWGTAKLQGLFLPPVPLLRTEFDVAKTVQSANLYVTALGNADAYLNGKRVSEEYFTPGWTDYSKRVYYRTYDVTQQINQGKNALGGTLADGWFSGYIGWGRNRDHYGKKPRLKMQLDITYMDGTTETFGTGADWKATAGPTREADFLMGERYDARLALPDWAEPGIDQSAWKPVDVGTEFRPSVEAAPGPPVGKVSEFSPVSITQPRPDTYVFDLGQNFAGVVQLKVSGEQGQQIRLRFAERLNPDGTLYTTNLRGARTIDTYVCNGEGIEVWQPRFTFHGFQYVEVTGLTSPPDKETITGIALSSDTPLAGRFECSDPMLNRLHKNILWTQYANFIDIPTDCPQRDERLGWTGDAQVYVATAALNTDVQAFFDKWLVDLTDAQRADGQFPRVAPQKVGGEDGGPAWADAGVICPWTIYEVYGDRRLLERHYPSMKKFIEFCRQRSQDGVLPPQDFHCYGDWLSINADTPKEVIYMAYYAHSVRVVAEAAEVLGYREEAAEYRALYEEIKTAFNEKYVSDDGRITGDTQCCYVLALANDLLDESQREQAAEHLVAEIAKRGYHLSTGFVGTKDLMLVLSKIGRNDIAYRLLHNETFPSWGFSIKHGATSIWERWDGWTPEKGFQDPGMNSFAHYSFGAVYQWMAENIGGIHRLEPGYKRFAIAPQLGGKLTWAKTDYDSIHGRISSHWEVDADHFSLKIAVPVSTTAEVYLPTANVSGVTLNKQPLEEETAEVDLLSKSGNVVLAVPSGEYQFQVKLD